MNLRNFNKKYNPFFEHDKEFTEFYRDIERNSFFHHYFMHYWKHSHNKTFLNLNSVRLFYLEHFPILFAYISRQAIRPSLLCICDDPWMIHDFWERQTTLWINNYQPSNQMSGCLRKIVREWIIMSFYGLPILILFIFCLECPFTNQHIIAQYTKAP